MTFKTILLYVSSLFILAGCGTAPTTQFYLLKAISPENTEINTSQIKSTTILVNPIKFPEYLDRPQMVTRTSPYKLKLSEKHRWAEPLNNEFTRVLIKNINSRISPNHAVEYSELNGAQPNIHLSIKALRLDVNAEGQAVLSVNWSYWTDQNRTVKRFSNEYSIPVKNKTYETRVEAQSQAIALFANDLIKSLPLGYKG